jgi:hypothetical protein
MTPSQLNPRNLTPSFQQPDGGLAPTVETLDVRDAFYYFVNAEEHAEVLPLAYDVVMSRLERGAGGAGVGAGEHAGNLDSVLAALRERRRALEHPWEQGASEIARRRVLHYFLQFMPTALVDGCWLQCGARVSTAHTPMGSQITGLYAHQIRALVPGMGRHFSVAYRAACARLAAPLDELSTRSFAQRPDLEGDSFALPVFLLAIAQYTRTFSAEILGVNLAWQFLDLSAFGPRLLRDVCAAYQLPPPEPQLDDADHFERGREMAHDAVLRYVEAASEADRPAVRASVLRGVNAALGAWMEWLAATRASAPMHAPDLRQEILDILRRKAPHAAGYHGDKSLAGKRIDAHLDPKTFDGPALLDALASSRWIKPGRADLSGFLRHLVRPGGPMHAVFSAAELEVIGRWVDSLPPKSGDTSLPLASRAGPAGPAATAQNGRAPRAPRTVSGRLWTKSGFQRRSAALHGACTTRELFHYLVNVEFHPEILPVAERYARDRLERSMATVRKGERAIPSDRYDARALEAWVHRKHREQVDSYRPPHLRPEPSREEFVESSVQLAPIVLIDGAWLQGVASPAVIHTAVGRMLFHIMAEEIGEGRAEEHHANLYRALLAAMGEDAPPVDSWEFVRWPRLQDASFEVPTLWLAISCFPRHFLPEILGLNLAVELAGVGGPYMEARDALRRFGLPTQFVDVHNAADNVAAGHSAWAMHAIRRYLDEVAEREGPHSLDHTWRRVWSGVRATLPQISRLRLTAHRIARRLFGRDPTVVPSIFPS